MHAETGDLADQIRIEQVTGPKGLPTLRVRYPVGNHQTYRYPHINGKESSAISSWFSGGNQIDYDGQRVKVSGMSGCKR